MLVCGAERDPILLIHMQAVQKRANFNTSIYHSVMS